MTTGDVSIEILDGGAGVVVVPANSVQLVIGPSTDGTAAQIVPTRSPNTLASAFTSGPLPESAALACLAGGTVLAMRAATDTDGEASAVTMTRVGTSTCVISVSGTPVDESYFTVKTIKGGMTGTAGITFKVSADAGRNFGPTIALGTSTTYVIPGTGLTLAFTGSSTLDAGDLAQFGTTPPLTDTAGVMACLNAFKASQYAVAGVGSTHIVGAFSGADLATIQGYMDDLENRFIFGRAICELADASPPAIWGGNADSEDDWLADMATEVSALSARRICPCAGSYNMPSAFPTAVMGAPRYRRNLAWALAARQVGIPPQRHAGRVRDGALSQIVVDPVNDPGDGFIYHDESLNPGLDAARITSARLRIGLPGYYITNPLLASPPGSVFTLLPLGNVMDRACGIIHQVGQQEINEDIRLNPNGTIFENEAQAIERVMLGTLNAQMTAKNMISSAQVFVDRSTNVRATSIVNIAVTIFSRGYVLEEDIQISFANPFAAT